MSAYNKDFKIENYEDGEPKFPRNVFWRETYTKEESLLYWEEQMRLFDLWYPHFHEWCQKKTFGDPVGFDEFIEDFKRRRRQWFDGGYAYESAKRGPEVTMDGKSAAYGEDEEEVSVGGYSEDSDL